MKSPIKSFAVWTLCLLMSGGCGSMQNAYENYLRQEILDRGQWTMSLDAGVGQKGIEGRLMVNGCVDVEVEAAHDEFVPINEPQQTPPPAGGFRPVTPAVRPAWTPRAEMPTVVPQPLPTVSSPANQPGFVPPPKSAPQRPVEPVRPSRPTYQPAQPAARPNQPVAVPARPDLAPYPARPAAPAAPAAVPPQRMAPSVPAARPDLQPATRPPRSESQPAPAAPSQANPPVRQPAPSATPTAKPTQGITLPRGAARPVAAPVQARPVMGTPTAAPAPVIGTPARKPAKPRITLPTVPVVPEGSDDTSLPTDRFQGAALAMLWSVEAESELGSAAVKSGRVTAQNGDDWDESDEAPAVAAPAGFTVVKVPARYENRCETWGVSGASIRVSVGDVDASATTEKDGRFYISDGAVLARLQAAGDTGTVTALLNGRQAQAPLRLGGLNEVAAFRLLDAMTRPTTEEVIAFVQEWRGTDAATLAVDRFGPQACGEFRQDWDEMMATTEMPRILAVQGRYQGAWSEVFAEPCAAEISMLPTLEDMASELGLLGAP